MRLPPSELDPGMWVTIPKVGSGMILDIRGEDERGIVQLGILLEYPPTTNDYYVANLYHHDFVEVDRE
jgi:hypothetical protein